jgi:hypothetical protein
MVKAIKCGRGIQRSLWQRSGTNATQTGCTLQIHRALKNCNNLTASVLQHRQYPLSQ